MTKIGILTHGGDAPGLNVVIRNAVKFSEDKGNGSIIGIRNGFDGILKEDVMVLDGNIVRDWDEHPGTKLGTSRTEIYNKIKGIDRSEEIMYREL